jgi:hypothetical protein
LEFISEVAFPGSFEIFRTNSSVLKPKESNMKKLPASSSSPSLFGAPVLLAMDSPEEFASMQAALIDEIMPDGPIERMYVENAAETIWELKNLRRIKALTVRIASRAGLENLLKQTIRDQHFMLKIENEEKAEQLALDYFKCKVKKKEVLELLAEFELDARAIDAEAFRLRLPDLDTLNKMLITSEKRLNKMFRLIAEYRKDLAKLLRRRADRILDVADSPDLESQDQHPAVV